MSVSWKRRSVILCALVLLGAAFGSLSAMTVLLLNGFWRMRDGGGLSLIPLIYFGTVLGAPLGAVFAPTLGWLLLRDVPIGKALLWATAGCVVGSLAGGVLGRLLNRSLDGAGALGLLVGALVGVIVASVLLRHRYSIGKRAAI